MPARFRIYDIGPYKAIDRYTILDSKQYVDSRGTCYYSYCGFDEHPYHPQGFGQHGELTVTEYMGHAAEKFKSLGKRVAGNDLPPGAVRLVNQFMKDSEGSKATMHTAMTKSSADE